MRRLAHKYSAKRVESAGRSFASKLEASVFQLLTLMERAGEIKDIQCQCQVALSKAQIIYKPDFAFTNIETGLTEYAEAKGYQTPEWRIKRRLWMAYGPAPLHVYTGSHLRPMLSETIIPNEASE